MFLFTKVRTHINEYTVSLAIRHGNYTRTRDLTNNTVLWRIRISGYGDVGQREFNPPIDKNEKERQHRPIRSSKPREFVPFAAFSISFLSKHTREKKSFAKIFSLTRYNFFPVNLFLPSPPTHPLFIQREISVRRNRREEYTGPACTFSMGFLFRLFFFSFFQVVGEKEGEVVRNIRRHAQGGGITSLPRYGQISSLCRRFVHLRC